MVANWRLIGGQAYWRLLGAYCRLLEAPGGLLEAHGGQWEACGGPVGLRRPIEPTSEVGGTGLGVDYFGRPLEAY